MLWPSAPAVAADWWLFDASGDWFVGANWFPGGVPGGGDTVIVDTDGIAVIETPGAVSTTAELGQIVESSGGVMVNDAGTWANSGTIRIGVAGNGALDVTAGGSVTSFDGIIGTAATSDGAVVVDGIGSSWRNTGNLIVGFGGEGTLAIANGGTVTAAAVTIAVLPGLDAIGTLSIGAAAGDAAAGAGTLDTASLTFGDGTGTLVFNHTGTDYDFDPAISGTGTIDHRAGITTLTADSSAFAGSTTLSAGTLVVDGQLGGTLNVTNAFLGGSGTVGATVLGAGAVMAPGNSIGTLNVAGTLDFASGSTYEVEVDDGGNTPGANNDWIHATGIATIDSAAMVTVLPENGTDDGSTYTPGTVYTILTADGGVNGVFGGVTDGFAFLTSTLSYDALNVYLTLLSSAAFQDAARTPNQFNTAGAADALGAVNPLYDEIVPMTEADARAAFDALSGEIHASGQSVAFHSMRHVREALLSRLRARLGGPRVAGFAEAPAADDETSGETYLWGHAFGAWGSADGNGNYAKLDRRSSGFLGGVDKAVGENARIGVALGYSRSDFDASARSSSGDSDNFHIAAYAGTRLGIVNLGGVLSYAYGKSETERTVIVGGLTDTLTADYDAHTSQAAVEAGIDVDMGSVVLTPFAGISAIHVGTDGFTEQGGPAALTVSSADNTTGVTTVGLRARRQAGQVALTGSLAWRHAFGDVDPSSRMAFASAPATSFTVRGAPVSENALALEAGVGLALAERTSLALSYAGEYGSDATDHGLQLELTFRF